MTNLKLKIQYNDQLEVTTAVDSLGRKHVGLVNINVDLTDYMTDLPLDDDGLLICQSQPEYDHYDQLLDNIWDAKKIIANGHWLYSDNQYLGIYDGHGSDEDASAYDEAISFIDSLYDGSNTWYCG